MWVTDLGGVSSNLDSPPDYLGMLAIEKEAFDCFVTIAIAIFFTALPVFPSKIVLG